MVTKKSEEASGAGVFGVVFALGLGEPGGSVGVDDGEGRLLPDFKFLTLEEEEIVVILGASRSAVDAGSGAGARAFAVFFLGVMLDLGRKVDKVDKDTVNVYLHHEE